MNAISCRGISKSFGATLALDGLELEVPEGLVVAILGASGSGKTTLLRLIAGFERPGTGTIEIGGEVVDSARRYVPPEKRRAGYVTQEGNLFPHLNVARNVAFGLRRAERTARAVSDLLDLVGLAGLGKRYPHQLSGGQQQRVALARALAHQPRALLLDEPFSSLDAGGRTALRHDVMRILRARGTTTVLVTHDQQEALSVADMVGIISEGRIRQFASPEVVYNRPADPAVARFLGEANILAANATRSTVQTSFVETSFGRLELAEDAGTLQGPVWVLLRPEQLSLRPLPTGGPLAAQPVGRVAQVEFYGHDCVVLVSPTEGGGPLRVRCPGRPPLQLGELVAISARGEVTAWPRPEPPEPAELREASKASTR